MPDLCISKQIEIQFADGENPPTLLDKGTLLSTALNATNSPLLFGCRIGICGTCVMEVESSDGLPPPDELEAETLSLYAPGNSKARLACQVSACANMVIRRVK